MFMSAIVVVGITCTICVSSCLPSFVQFSFCHEYIFISLQILVFPLIVPAKFGHSLVPNIYKIICFSLYRQPSFISCLYG